MELPGRLVDTAQVGNQHVELGGIDSIAPAATDTKDPNSHPGPSVRENLWRTVCQNATYRSHDTSRLTAGQRRRSSASGFVVLAVVALLAMPFAGLATPARGAAEGLSPDLVALPPADLYFSREVLADGQAHLLLRFTATSWNAGEGPLELAGTPEPGGIVVWQQIYDAPADGQVVARRRLAADLIDHPQHGHFHLADYFQFTLQRRGSFGVPRSLPIATGKLSSCVFDDVLIDQTNQPPRHYKGCGADTQGMSPGWVTPTMPRFPANGSTSARNRCAMGRTCSASPSIRSIG